MRWLRQVASLLLAAVLLAGPPLLLVRVVGWPSAGGARAAFWQWVREPLTDQSLIMMVGVLAWLLWAFVAYIVTVRTVQRLWAGVRWLRRLPLPTPWQATATGMAGAAALTIATPATSAVGVDGEGTTTSATDTVRDDVERRGTVDGVAVSGGWLPHSLAEQVSVAAGLVWLRRRRVYLPTHPRRYDEGAGDLAPLPATVAAIQATTSHHSTSPPAQAAAGVPVIGFPPTRVGLTGPGALDAARGLLITVLLSRMRQSTTGLLITRRALDMLLGPAAARLQPGAGLRIADSAAHATTLLTAPDTATAPGGVDGGRLPVLILDQPPEGMLADALPRVATVVVLAGWPHATTWHVAADGHTHASDAAAAGGRVCVLDAVATTDLLTVTGHLHPPAPDTPTHSAPQARIPRQAAPRHDGVELGRRLRVRVLGEPTLLVDGTVLALRRTAARQALVFLAVHPDGVDSHLMAEALWPGLPAHRLTGRLYTTLSELRTVVHATTGLHVVDRAGNRYRLHPDHVDVDLWRLRAVVDHAAAALTDAAAAWRAVIDAYTGDLAAGHTWAWLDPHRETARRHVLDAYTALAAAAPDPRQALAYLQDGIRVDPYNADLHQRAARILTDLGEHTAAAELSDRYTRRLTTAGLHLDDTALIRPGA
ncbi:hypothetical protein [Micromonospora sp. NPDC047134]|uniref:hypothetical protein n=1 Tax=Micromonospora sp. NPDC047134 TaxID=3154340 RepID=UPI0033FAE465